MKTLLITLAASCFLVQATYSQTNKKQMATIDQMKQMIDNNIAGYQKNEIIKDANSKCVYMDGKQLKMVTVDMKANNIDKKVEWYFANGELMYAQQVSTNIATGVITDNERTYAKDNDVFTWIKNGNVTVNNFSSEFKAMDTELMAYAAVLEKDSMKQQALAVR